MVGRKKTNNEGQYFGEFTPENMPYVPKKGKRRWYKGYNLIVLTSSLVFVAIVLGSLVLWGECVMWIFFWVIMTAVIVGGLAYEIGKTRAKDEIKEREERKRRDA